MEFWNNGNIRYRGAWINDRKQGDIVSHDITGKIINIGKFDQDQFLQKVTEQDRKSEEKMITESVLNIRDMDLYGRAGTQDKPETKNLSRVPEDLMKSVRELGCSVAGNFLMDNLEYIMQNHFKEQDSLAGGWSPESKFEVSEIFPKKSFVGTPKTNTPYQRGRTETSIADFDPIPEVGEGQNVQESKWISES